MSVGGCFWGRPAFFLATSANSTPARYQAPLCKPFFIQYYKHDIYLCLGDQFQIYKRVLLDRDPDQPKFSSDQFQIYKRVLLDRDPVHYSFALVSYLIYISFIIRVL